MWKLIVLENTDTDGYIPAFKYLYIYSLQLIINIYYFRMNHVFQIILSPQSKTIKSLCIIKNVGVFVCSLSHSRSDNYFSSIYYNKVT
jgi:hypothetical protein